MSTFGNTADIYAIVHLVPHACQHITVDQIHSSGDTVAKIWRLAGSGGTKTVSFTNRQKKKSHGVKWDRSGHRINVLKRVWNELDYRIDVCRITKGGHIERLWNM